MDKLITDLDSKFRSGSNHAFLFHLNVDDLFIDKDGELRSLTEILLSAPPLRNSYFTAFFNLATGIRFIDQEQEEKFIQFLDVFDKDEIGRFREHRYKLSYAIALFTKYLKKSRRDNGIISALNKAKQLNPMLGDFGDKDTADYPFFSIVIEYLETIVNPQAASSSCQIDREALVAHLVWAKDPIIRRSNNLVFLITDSLSSVAPQLRAETGEIAICKVDFPNQSRREAIYRLAIGKTDPSKEDLEPGVFARSSGGISAKGIVSLTKECLLTNKPLSAATLFTRKKKFIEEKSGGLLEIKRPICGIKAIGGLEQYKEYIANVVKNMKQGNWGAVPNGILLLGAPGTGKTVFAEAVAFEADIPFVSMKNIREMWVGSSERNLDLSLSLIEAQSPAVVFIDEIDQQIQARSGIGDNTGVNQRLMARLFEFMSNTNLRGRVLWLAASNRPDLMDPALIREGRFDDKLPFFPPSSADRADIVRALLYKNKVLSEDQGSSFEWELTDEDIAYFARRAHCHVKGSGQETEIFKCNEEEDHPLGLKENEDKDVYLTGGQIENIIRRARERAAEEDKLLNRDHLFWALVEDFIPGREVADYETMTELAVNYANSARFLPSKGRWAKFAIRKGVLSNKTPTSKPTFDN